LAKSLTKAGIVGLGEAGVETERLRALSGIRGSVMGTAAAVCSRSAMGGMGVGWRIFAAIGGLAGSAIGSGSGLGGAGTSLGFSS